MPTHFNTDNVTDEASAPVVTGPSASPESIWLSPICDDEAHHGEGRTWAAPAPAQTCEDCDEPWIEYVRADLAAQSAPAGVGDMDHRFIAEQLSTALVDRNEGRFRTVAFVYRHEIIAALAPSASAETVPAKGLITDETPAIPAGMKPWAGGDSAPEDWDGDDVLARSYERGPMFMLRAAYGASVNWRADAQFRVIAYTPAPAAPAQSEVERLREALAPFARLGGPINGEAGRISYVDAIGGDDAGEELELSTRVGNGVRTETMWAEDFRRAYAATLAPTGAGEQGEGK